MTEADAAQTGAGGESKDGKMLIREARKEGRAALDEAAGKALLAQHGIAVPKTIVVKDVAQVAQALQSLAPPFVVKVVSSNILHKSDAGGVSVNLKTVDEVRHAIVSMAALPKIQAARVDGWLIEEMAPAGQEIVIGGLRDPDFGPVVMVGLGGIFVEVLGDVSFRICPITPIDAHEMVEELKGAAVLRGARGRKPVSREAIVELLLKIGGENGLLMQYADEIKEADINPVIVSESGAVAVDARFILT
jgi:acyl-CoA synthetase (NDP forming)